MRAVFEPHDIRTDRVPGQADVMQDGLARAVDLKPDAPTYLFKRGNEKLPDHEHPVTPGVPEVLKGEFAIEPVSLPVEAYYPNLRAAVVAEELARANQQVADAEAARSKAQTDVVTARQKLAEATAAVAASPSENAPPAGPGGAAEATVSARAALEAAVAVADAADLRLAVARASRTAYEARVAAERAKYGLDGEADAGSLAIAASRAERELALCQAQEQRAAAIAEESRARAAATGGDAAAQTALAEAQQKTAAAAEALAAAHAELALPRIQYQPLGDVLPSSTTGRRLALARWITSRDNPLAARVAVNHIWLRHFGAPLVDNMFDFGLRSPQARNQALLDWLAVELVEHGWQMKHIHRLIVTSRTYQMASDGGAEAAANAAVDPDNRWLWRMNPRRLEAEAVRDAVLSTAGSLDLALGGPDIDCKLAFETSRRSIYLRHAYEKQARFLELFDGASVNECYRRSESVAPHQALALANSDLTLVESRRLAGRLSAEAGKEVVDDDAFIERAFERVLGRRPVAAELAECRQFLRSQTALLARPEGLTSFSDGATTAVAAAADPAARARENLVHVLFNHNDFVTIR
jgi:hypothetical protein